MIKSDGKEAQKKIEAQINEKVAASEQRIQEKLKESSYKMMLLKEELKSIIKNNKSES